MNVNFFAKARPPIIISLPKNEKAISGCSVDCLRHWGRIF